jgi:hypothetical protein
MLVIMIQKSKDTHEFRVPGPEHIESQAYYTNDVDDAVATAYKIHGKKIEIKFVDVSDWMEL